MPEKARKPIKSRKNKRKTSLKSRKGGGVWDSLKKVLPKKKTDEAKLLPEESPIPQQDPKPKTLKDLELMFNGHIPLEIFKIDFEKIEELKKTEATTLQKFENLPEREEPSTELNDEDKLSLDDSPQTPPQTSNVPTPPDEDKPFI
jgi:hypothetical protein